MIHPAQIRFETKPQRHQRQRGMARLRGALLRPGDGVQLLAQLVQQLALARIEETQRRGAIAFGHEHELEQHVVPNRTERRHGTNEPAQELHSSLARDPELPPRPGSFDRGPRCRPAGTLELLERLMDLPGVVDLATDPLGERVRQLGLAGRDPGTDRDDGGDDGS